MCQNLVSFTVLGHIEPQAPLLGGAHVVQLDLVSMCHRSATSDRVSVGSLLPGQATKLIHGSSVQRTSQTQLGLAIASSRNPMLQHASTSLPWSRSFRFRRALGFSVMPFFRFSRISCLQVMCSLETPLVVSKCPTCLRKRHLPCEQPDLVPCMSRHKFFRPLTAHPAWVKAYHSLST